MSDELSLFGDETSTPEPADQEPAPISDWQVQLLRKALDSRGLTEMVDRQKAIETAAGRPVESLRSLSHEEALQVLARLGSEPPAKPVVTSAWDDREEDTWIDRL
ncbi:hypothetical protein GL325_06375 [Aeromicrobium sp. 636]|uniref:Uncharacterized protein n=1 Tax=Aeromicrobium senzhongii TaxID=2663859 RepID=A0A8I0K0L8_9ACTN|nr:MULTISPECIES: hypothetical protein [Aeromicrobium]MBC9225938.1 hypothetical protein [Aeromicrobium senzhongii]MCQ3998045.1 hypothetical protein [Aeromicrobium sp. 636]